MTDIKGNIHCRTGWKGSLRWIEVDNVKVHETDQGAIVTTTGQEVSADGLRYLATNLLRWFCDPEDRMSSITERLELVKRQVEAWNKDFQDDEAERVIRLCDEALASAKELMEVVSP